MVANSAIFRTLILNLKNRIYIHLSLQYLIINIDLCLLFKDTYTYREFFKVTINE